ncbi:putative thioesterase [Gordonia araii NBRC 100433]|uniref:Putative thioesterase n=1 Tax=Gordonia araii NBRC 100433 TaxID=1073574 RepID=G7H0S5_9ACTN|nr:PaaI family thioesterase [Gordonia araii]NNG96787.1 PaaI family thioesterase [Gordonia araii NBRC 100433]GAB09450.1 putative thioesterase [Gordonia araii NBRC 100433]
MTDNNPALDTSEASGLDAALGMKIVEATADGVVAEMPITPNHHQPFGIVHGGVYCAIAESVASISGFLWLQHTEIGGTAVGVNNNTDFLKSVSEGTIVARSTPVHRGKRQQLWQVEMSLPDGTLLAQGRVRLQNV